MNSSGEPIEKQEPTGEATTTPQCGTPDTPEECRLRRMEDMQKLADSPTAFDDLVHDAQIRRLRTVVRRQTQHIKELQDQLERITQTACRHGHDPVTGRPTVEALIYGNCLYGTLQPYPDPAADAKSDWL